MNPIPNSTHLLVVSRHVVLEKKVRLFMMHLIIYSHILEPLHIELQNNSSIVR